MRTPAVKLPFPAQSSWNSVAQLSETSPYVWSSRVKRVASCENFIATKTPLPVKFTGGIQIAKKLQDFLKLIELNQNEWKFNNGMSTSNPSSTTNIFLVNRGWTQGMGRLKHGGKAPWGPLPNQDRHAPPTKQELELKSQGAPLQYKFTYKTTIALTTFKAR